MAHRLDQTQVDINNTEQLLSTLLAMTRDEVTRVAFLVPAGQGPNTMARVRVMISRWRKKLSNSGRQLRRFTIRNTIHPETHNGIRYDCVIVWRLVTTQHGIKEVMDEFGSQLDV